MTLKMHSTAVSMNPLSYGLLLVAISMIVLVSSQSGVQGVSQETLQQTDRPQCVCSRLWAPVCGTDGKTYENEGCLRVQTTKCGTEQSLVSEAYEGECQQSNLAAIGERLCTCIFVFSICVNVFLNFRKIF